MGVRGMNKEEINRLLSEYESTVHQINELKVEAEILKRELLLEESKIALYPKEQWKALDISNAEGRKAYAVIALQDLKFEVSDVLNEVSQLGIDYGSSGGEVESGLFDL